MRVMKMQGNVFARVMLSCAFVAFGCATAAAQTQTAQSAMVNIELASESFEIDGTITWTFERGVHQEPDTAMGAYTNVVTGGPTLTACNGSAANCAATNAPSEANIAAAAPLPDEVKLQQHAQAQRCTFFFGGTLSGDTYTQSATLAGANGRGGWVYEWSYTIAPVTSAVDAYTAWSSEETGGTVDINFSGFVASESFMKQSNKNKFSFTMVDGGVSRARGLMASLTGVGTIDLTDTDTNGDAINDAVAIVAAPADFSYFGNGGVFGNTSVYGALHAATYKPANMVTNILTGVNDGANSDNFAGNNNDLAAGNVHIAPFGNTFAGLTQAGDYTISVSGILKGNNSLATANFSVASNLISIGGCTAPLPQ
jgi:hypothetical protein